MAKVNFGRGEFLLCLKDLETVLTELKPNLTDVTESYVYLKTMMLKAKSLSKISEFTKADEVCKEVAEFVKDKEEVETYFKFAIKAQYLRSKHMQKCMEF